VLEPTIRAQTQRRHLQASPSNQTTLVNESNLASHSEDYSELHKQRHHLHCQQSETGPTDRLNGANINSNNGIYFTHSPLIDPNQHQLIPTTTTRILTDEKGHSIKIRIASPPQQRSLHGLSGGANCGNDIVNLQHRVHLREDLSADLEDAKQQKMVTAGRRQRDSFASDTPLISGMGLCRGGNECGCRCGVDEVVVGGLPTGDHGGTNDSGRGAVDGINNHQDNYDDNADERVDKHRGMAGQAGAGSCNFDRIHKGSSIQDKSPQESRETAANKESGCITERRRRSQVSRRASFTARSKLAASATSVDVGVAALGSQFGGDDGGSGLSGTMTTRAAANSDLAYV